MTGRRATLDDVRRRALKPRDSWWTVLFVDPIAIRLTLVAARTPLTPNQISALSLATGLAASWFFWSGARGDLFAGAALYHLSFTFDCVDGKIARLKGTGTPAGEWVDYIFDRVRVLVATLALFGGRFRETGDELALVLATVVVFLDMLRYLDALKIDAAHAKLAAATGSSPSPGAARAGAPSRFPMFVRFRDALGARRVRPHLFGGVEFQMFVFIVGPLAGQIVWVTVASAALLLLFEAAVVADLFLAARQARAAG